MGNVNRRGEIEELALCGESARTSETVEDREVCMWKV